MTKGKSLRSNHLIVTRRASILILILIVLVLKCLWRRRGRFYEATKASLLLCNTTDTGVHPTQLITKSVKASIHALKLRYDCFEGHTTLRRRRRGRGRWSRAGWRNCFLGSWPFRLKLGLTLSNRHATDGTHDREVRRLGIGNRRVANDSCNNRRENKLITGRRIFIDIYKRV